MFKSANSVFKAAVIFVRVLNSDQKWNLLESGNYPFKWKYVSHNKSQIVYKAFFYSPKKYLEFWNEYRDDIPADKPRVMYQYLPKSWEKYKRTW